MPIELQVGSFPEPAGEKGLGKGSADLCPPGLLDCRLTPDYGSEKLCEGAPGRCGEQYAEKDKFWITLSIAVLLRVLQLQPTMVQFCFGFVLKHRSFT